MHEKPNYLLAFVLIGSLLAAAVIGGMLMPFPQQGTPGTHGPGKESSGGFFGGGGRAAARRMQCMNHLKQLALAMHNYHDVHGALPPAYTVDADGKPLHSWRVLLLPYIEQQALYSAIRLDEPWDSPHNLRFHHIAMTVFQCPSESRRDGFCSYSVVIGDRCVFEEGGESCPFADITDGLSDTVLIVERATPIDCWMDPTHEIALAEAAKGVDIVPDGIGSHHSSGCIVAMADGSVQFIASGPGSLETLFLRDVTASKHVTESEQQTPSAEAKEAMDASANDGLAEPEKQPQGAILFTPN